MGRSAATRSKPPSMTGEDLDARLGAVLGTIEGILAHPSKVCETAALELVNVAEQLAAVRVAREDALVDEFFISRAYAEGLAEGLRKAAEGQQLPRPRKGSHGRQGPLMKVIEGGLATVVAGAAIRAVKGAVGAHQAAAAALAVAVPTAAVTAVALLPPTQTLPDDQFYAGAPVTHGAVIQSASPVPSSQLIATVTQAAPKGKHRASVNAPTPLLLPSTSASAAVTLAPASSPAAQPSPSPSPSLLKPRTGSTGSPRHQRQPQPGSGQYSTASAGGWGIGDPGPGGSGNGTGGRHSWTPSPQPSPAASDTTDPATSSPAPAPSAS